MSELTDLKKENATLRFRVRELEQKLQAASFNNSGALSYIAKIEDELRKLKADIAGVEGNNLET